MRGWNVVAGHAFGPIVSLLLPGIAGAADATAPQGIEVLPPLHREVPGDPYGPNPMLSDPAPVGHSLVQFGPHVSYQVNVDAAGENICGDAANEPSIAVDPNNPNRMAIGWRQFDSIEFDFRQAGFAFTHDGGLTWTFPGTLEHRVFRSDPVLDVDSAGVFYYHSLDEDLNSDMFRSFDGGATWDGPHNAFGGDKHWFAVDRTGLPSKGNIYTFSNANAGCCEPRNVSRSTDGGLTFEEPVESFSRGLGTVAVGPDGKVHMVGLDAVYQSSFDVADPSVWPPTFDVVSTVNIGGFFGGGPNGVGLGGQPWVTVNNTGGPCHGDIYVLGSVLTFDPFDPKELHFTKSTDGGLTWSDPVRINDDPVGNEAYQWFGTMSVAPNGRIDAVWNDSRNRPAFIAQLYYAFSEDGGATWSANERVSPTFNIQVGYPVQQKLGDYYDMVSDNYGASIAYAATFNDEQDVYYLRIGGNDCNLNQVEDLDDIAAGTSNDCDANTRPDECDRDCNANLIADVCEEAALIEAQPQGQLACPGSTVQLVVSAPAAEALQWLLDGEPIEDGARISGSRSPALIIEDVGFADDGAYTCRIGSGCLETATEPAQLTVVVPAEVTRDPPTMSGRCLGQTLVLAIDSQGTAPTFEWRKDGMLLVKDERIAGVNTAELRIREITEEDNGAYACVVRDPCGGEDLSQASTFVMVTPVVTLQPTDTCVEPGNALVLTATGVTAAPALGYIWRENGNTLTDGSRISGSGTNMLTISNVVQDDAGTYSTLLYSLPSPICTTTSASAEVTIGGCPCLSVAACPDADVNCNGNVDFDDLAIITMSANWGLTVGEAAEPRCDVDRDGRVTGLDFAIAVRSGCFGM